MVDDELSIVINPPDKRCESDLAPSNAGMVMWACGRTTQRLVETRHDVQKQALKDVVTPAPIGVNEWLPILEHSAQ